MRVEVEWWPGSKFANRSMQIIGVVDLKTIEVPDGLVLCDYCNEQIKKFPVCVINASAVCPGCVERYYPGLKEGDTEWSDGKQEEE